MDIRTLTYIRTSTDVVLRLPCMRSPRRPRKVSIFCVDVPIFTRVFFQAALASLLLCGLVDWVGSQVPTSLCTYTGRCMAWVPRFVACRGPLAAKRQRGPERSKTPWDFFLHACVHGRIHLASCLSRSNSIHLSIYRVSVRWCFQGEEKFSGGENFAPQERPFPLSLPRQDREVEDRWKDR